jgi:hypothetical protein
MFAVVIVLCLSTASASAHHSFAAEYDGEKPVTFKGVLTPQPAAPQR